jgi:hypothetical protein
MAHTTPVYVTTGENGFLNPETASHYLDLSEQYLQEIEEEISEPNENRTYNAWRYKEHLEQRIAETRKVIEEIRMKLE